MTDDELLRAWKDVELMGDKDRGYPLSAFRGYCQFCGKGIRGAVMVLGVCQKCGRYRNGKSKSK